MDNSKLEKDKKWDIWNIESIEYFQNVVDKINFNPAISEDVIKRFEVVKKLIIHSYFEYEFLDVAFDRTLVNFEMALRRRYYELTNKESKNIEFKKLIKWSANQGLFEDDEEIIHKARELRNRLTAHPKSYHLLGYLAIPNILRTIDIINDLYEDIPKRKTSKQEENNINQILKNFIENGAILELKDAKLIIFKAILLFYNNKIVPNKYYFLFYPIFDPIEKENKINIPEPILKEFDLYEFINNIFFIFDNQNKEQVKIKKLNNPEDKIKYSRWRQDYKASTFPIQYFIDTKIGELKLQLRSKNF